MIHMYMHIYICFINIHICKRALCPYQHFLASTVACGAEPSYLHYNTPRKLKESLSYIISF